MLTAVLALAGCGGSTGTTAAGSSTPASGSASQVTGDINVFAAASLTGSFQAISEAFTAANPRTKVTFNFGASSALAQQITSGAPADVFAAASPATMKTVTDAGDGAGEPTVFVKNRLEIAVPKGNPGGIKGLSDFANKDLKIALCAPEVPCGAAAEKVFKATGIIAAPDTLDRDVKAALSKVELGEVDAALVYRTDVQAADDLVGGIEFPEADQAINDYPIVVLKHAPHSTAAQAFIAYVLSDEGQKVLTSTGFDKP